jgi:DNA-binding NarL/FixJ family response regulator
MLTPSLSSHEARHKVMPPAEASQRRRILVVDEHPLVREGLQALMAAQLDLVVCAEASNTREARAAIKQSNPDAVITSITLKNDDGIELVRDVRLHFPRLPILVLSAHNELIYAERVLASGANGYIMKGATTADILKSLRQVLAGGVYVSEVVSGNMLKRFTGGAAASDGPIERLSNRELQILRMLGGGMSTREMANTHNLSVKTVESHRQRIKRKLNLSSGSQLVQYAVSWTLHDGGEQALHRELVPSPSGSVS